MLSKIELSENIKLHGLRLKDIKTTANIYAHVTPKKKEKAAHKMDGLLRKHS